MMSRVLLSLFLFSGMALSGAMAPTMAQTPGSDFDRRTPAQVVELLGADSTRSDGRRELARLAASLPSDRATLWIQLLALGEQVPGATLGALAPVVLAVHQGEDDDAFAEMTRVMEALEAGSDAPLSAPVLALAAEVADRVDPATGAEFRERILDHVPSSLEAGEAALRLARYLLREDTSAPRGLRILEELVVTSPDHSVAPEARRLRQEALARGIEPEPDPPPEIRP